MVRSSAAKGRLLEVQARSSEGIVLPPGQFYGTLEQTRTGGAFDIRSLAASGREEDVAVHTHTDAHFVLVLSGAYISAARWAPERARAPFLVFNPPGTTHRDRFFEGVGSFLAISLSATTLAELRNLVTNGERNSTTAAGDYGGDGTAAVAVLRNECATLAEPSDAIRLGNRQQKDRQEGRARHPAVRTAGSA
jgi:hypothetical protein